MRQGDYVMTPRGPGRVAYVRMEPPDYSHVGAVSVVLASETGRPGYKGTIFNASEVEAQ